MEILERFSAEAISYMQHQINLATGAEVLFCAKQAESGLIEELYAAAHGTSSEVSALFPHMQAADVVIHNHPSGHLQPSRADLDVAAVLGQQGIGFYIINNLCSRVYCVAEPITVPSLEPLDADQVTSILSANGRLSQLIPNYEVREGQVQLTSAIVQAFNEDALLMAEAGTGIGKSFAYLIPALLWALKNQERIVISTATIALQEQLMNKDVPMVQRLLKSKSKVLLAKGRHHYLCLKRLQETLDEETTFLEVGDHFTELKEWSQVTTTGDKAELNFLPDAEKWQRVNCEPDTCIGFKCAFYEACFLNRARKALNDAHVIVANHHLVFADMNLRAESTDVIRIIPSYTRLIFDEAHNIESSASGFFSEQLTRYGLNRMLMRFFRRKKGAPRLGLLPALEELFSANKEAGKQIEQAYLQLEKAKEQVDALDLFSMTHLEEQFRLVGTASPAIEKGLLLPLKAVVQAFLKFHGTVTKLVDQAETPNSTLALVLETKNALGKISTAAGLCQRFIQYTQDLETVYWGERRRNSAGSEYYRLEATPLDLTEKMRTMLYEMHKTVVMVSATLAVNGDFTFFEKQVGLHDYAERLCAKDCFTSPFRYADVAMLAIPTDAPLPDSEPFTAYINNTLLNIFTASQGRGLALFTSYRALESASHVLQEALNAQGILVLKQGQAERSRLIAQFEAHGRAVLLATDSFWEGVDINNKALKVVVICRLPFNPPHAPVSQARSEQIALTGRSPFMELQLPEATIKLKQGFGRLIRKDKDSGVVCILDARIIKKNYGHAMLHALPVAKQLKAPTASLVREMETFLAKNANRIEPFD